MDKFAIRFAALFFATVISSSAYAGTPDGQTWPLPAKLGDDNTTVTFEVDSTWHTIHGKTSGVAGEVHLENPAQPDSIRGKITIPVGKFDTDNSSRDSRLREVMSEDKYANIEFELQSFAGSCPQPLPAAGCTGSAVGILKIADHEEPVNLDLKIAPAEAGLVVAGKSTFSWRIFPIEDPSILIAKLYDDVTVKFKLVLQQKNKGDV